MRTRLGTVIAVLLAAALTGCGGSPGDASVKEFCAGWSADHGNGVDAVHERAAALEEVGTPEGIDGDARDGFEVFVEELGSVDADQLEQLDQAAADEAGLAEVYGIDEDAARDILAFFDYVDQTCALQGADPQPADSASAGADEEALTAFAGRYLAALTRPDGASADQLTCEGASTLHGVVAAVPDGSWELGPVSLGEDGTGFAELRETVGGTTLGMQAELRDGEWCALQ